MQKYFFVINYLVIIIFCIIYFKKYKHNFYLKIFLGFLIYSFFTEVLGTYFGFFLAQKTFFIYNTWIISSCLFYFLFFLSKIKNIKKRKYIKVIIVFYIVYTIINISFFKEYLNQGLIDNIILGRILIATVIMIYYTELLKSDEILNIKKSLVFWISIGVLIYNIGIIPVYVIAEFISYKGIFRHIIFGLNIIMSLCFISGFILSEKKYNN